MKTLISILKRFEKRVDEALNLVAVANEALGPAASGMARSEVFIPHIYIYEIAFLKIFTAWENFLEESFIEYMTGKQTAKSKPRLYLTKIKKDHAIKLIVGTLEYPDWTTIDTVCKLAGLFFVKGRPFEMPLREIEREFKEMKKVRNAIVHVSSNARDKFLFLVKSKLPSYSSGITPGQFLNSSIRRGSNETFLVHYTDYLRVASGRIIK